jgi:small subunit ribosomal protein S17e
MGKVRSDHVKKASRKLIQRFPDRFITDFESDKKALEAIARINSTKMRNRIAGYITRLVARSHRRRAA